ncbi:MAG: HK97 family phage prohead protease [Anaerolineaceae bacterium]|nr:MAG: HK97 family phage prohead protease [Anaerolineaceae bacterium]
MDIERRYASLEGIEIRASDTEAPRMAGFAAVYNVLSEDLGGFRERIAPGAFSKSLGNDVRALFNHDPNFVLGRTRSKTLGLSETPKGLAVEIFPPNSAQSRSLMESMKRGDIDQMSFGFSVRKNGQKWEQEGDIMVRTLLDVDLIDVSVVTFPAYPKTEIALRSLDEFQRLQSAHDFTGQIDLLRKRLDLLII